MKVLFAVSNENISESIVKKYQKDYKEIISYKNVYYFNAILKEIQKDKTYDRIVISEDLEPFSNNNYDQIDKFLFDKLDSISDEATSSNRADTPIILICTDRRNKSEEILVKLFSIGIYNALIGTDRSIDEICRLIKVPRTKKEAKVYYRIDSEDATYQSENENDVSEAEIQNILAHYKRIGKNEEKYVESFNTIAAQYTDEQLKIIISFLPINVKAVLEANSPKYQQIVTTMQGGMGKATRAGKGNIPQENEEDGGIKVNLLETKRATQNLGKPVVIPSAVNTSKVKKLNKKVQAIEEQDDGINLEEPIQEEPIVKETVEQVKPKRRGRPRKNPLPEPKPEEEKVEAVTLPGFDDEDDEEEEMISSVSPTLPGFDDEEEEIETRAATLPGFDDEEEEMVKPQENFRPRNNFNANPISQMQSNPYQSQMRSSNHFESNSRELANIDYTVSNIDHLLTQDKKLVAFVGTSKNGTSFLVNNVAEVLSAQGIKTAILDTTQNKNAYYIYTKNEEDLRQVAADCITKLKNGVAAGIQVNKNLTVYTTIPNEENDLDSYEEILSTLIQNYSLVLIDCDFQTNLGYFARAQELYLVQSMDVLTIQPLTAFLRELKAKNILKPEKIRIVINKETKVRSLSVKTIIGGMSFYNDPAMSFMTELFDREVAKYCVIPFEEQTYAKYLEGLVNCKISLNGYSKELLQALKTLGNMVYPLIGGKQEPKPEYKPVNNNYNNNSNNRFSADMNNALDQMKKRY